jgi:hypothetical protein
MQENRISINIAPEDKQKVMEAIKSVSDIMAKYVVALKPDERRKLPKMSDGTTTFVKKALDYATTNPTLLPSFLNLEAFRIDIDATDTLVQLQRPLEQVTSNLNDTIMLSGSEAYRSALAFYNNVKQAAKLNVAGAKTIAEDLRVRFEKAAGKKEEQVAKTVS